MILLIDMIDVANEIRARSRNYSLELERMTQAEIEHLTDEHLVYGVYGTGPTIMRFQPRD